MQFLENSVKTFKDKVQERLHC